MAGPPESVGMNLQKFVAHVEQLKQREDGFSEEYQLLKSKSVAYKRDIPRTHGQKACNSKKNRYKDILPYDKTRVELPLVDGVDGTDYINANYLRIDNLQCRVIAAQGPLSSTTLDFWRMLWVHNISVVVMVARVVEMGKKKCEKYWPDDGSAMKYGEVIVHNDEVNESFLPNFVVRKMRIVVAGVTRILHHFQYLAWPDHGVPDSPKSVMQMLKTVRETVNVSVSPMVMHCSAGCGRTGTVAVIDHIWTLLEEGFLVNEIDIFKITDEFRQCRQAIIQTKDQYLYAYKSVLDLIDTIRTNLPTLMSRQSSGNNVAVVTSDPVAPALPPKKNEIVSIYSAPIETSEPGPATYVNLSGNVPGGEPMYVAPKEDLDGHGENLYVNMSKVDIGDRLRARALTKNLAVPKVNDVFLSTETHEEDANEDDENDGADGAYATIEEVSWSTSSRDTKRTRMKIEDFPSMNWSGKRGNRIEKPLGPRLPSTFTIDGLLFPNKFA